MTDNTPTSAEVTERDVYITRAFDAPRDVVWRFFTEPERIAAWFGPAGISTPVDTVTVELREGGRWELTMVDDATGAEYPLLGTIMTCIAPEYLEIVASAETGVGPIEDVVLRIQFHDHGDRTRITLHQGPFTDEQKEQTATGWEMSFVKLDKLFAEAGS
ncbi:MAG: hypothetical protein QOE16_1077 [Microbacteriaceae bacterium]|jgi:uncharacterized protein YndB with AHSA1/START domain|nr:hypothetical protein [Microbacteriaceae bacterium]